MPPLEKETDVTYTCAFCQGVFGLRNDADWNDDKAEKEYASVFPVAKATGEKRTRVCDDCWQVIKPR